MNKCLVFFFIFFVKIAFSQVNDNFDDGDFANAPKWTGSNSGEHFIVDGNQLRSNSESANSNFYLSTPSSLANNCAWEFYCNLKFATSSANYTDIYLISDQANLQAANINGYFVRIGNTNDEISLYKRSGSISVKLIDGADLSVSSSTNNRIKVKVTRTSGNLFNLERDLTGTGASYVSEGVIMDGSFNSSAYFGIYIQQSTSSFFKKHFFDNISIRQLSFDQDPPKLLSVTVLDEKRLTVSFDEAITGVSATNVLNYSLSNGYGNPQTVVSTAEPNRYILGFANNFTPGSYTLTAMHIFDESGNQISGHNSGTFSYIPQYIPRAKDVVINEIFADPTPVLGLPGAEFIELWNTTSQVISLENWKYSDAASAASLPAYVLDPGEHLLLCAKADTSEFKKYGEVLGISPWPSLNNSNDRLKLFSSQNVLIDSVSYTDTWYKDPEKQAGGWSIELIDKRETCTGMQNWTASIDVTGGTPGRQNSVFRSDASTLPLSLTGAFVKDSITIQLSFNRPVDSLSAASSTNYQVNNGLGSPASVKVLSPELTKVEMTYHQVISRGKLYSVLVSGLTDCSGILISANNNSAQFDYSNAISQNDILISEILFNPRPECADFVEIYNNGDVPFDLRELSIATIKEQDSLVSIKKVSSAQLMLQPKHYLVLSSDPDNIKMQYRTDNPDAFLKMASMPALNDDAGTLVLLAGENRIDQFSYTAKMHFALIKDPEGISLERVSYKRPSDEPGNFRSAASSVGFATPGYKNSQSVEPFPSEDAVFLLSKTFSPDNDGFEDALLINYKFPEAGLVANATIYNDKGVLIRKLAKNTTLANEGSITWDGLDEKSRCADMGIYVLCFDVFDLKGNIRKYRKSCVLATKLN
ncbi:lamin tail domain-containing protein [Desertivirga xinjiangensis]|uniref:lamin tail domain-containing protein n=1 Tax=Desertivirga xinjiangensis TaxID=539206 RepID=UPI00210CFE92|nr:lamin tail domain-containing protein [Pedobacter xinjiangensis]